MRGRQATRPQRSLLFEYMEGGSGRVWSVKRSAELDVRLRWIRLLLILDRGKAGEVWISNLGGQCQITIADYSRQLVYNELEVIVPGRNPVCFTIVIGRDGSNLSACPGSHAFVYYPEEVK